MRLYDYQVTAVNKMKNGCILCGGVGSGKSITSIAYFWKSCGGDIFDLDKKPTAIRDLYIITTARKRDTHEWDGECIWFRMHRLPEFNIVGNNVIVDSWNNIAKYKDVNGAFFIFDEQRVVGRGAWVKAFLNIARKNKWILLSATPGDTWTDYIPVFIANGFYKNRTEFSNRHIIYSRFTKYPQIQGYLDTGVLIHHRNDILVTMDFVRETHAHTQDILVDYDMILYRDVMKNRWNIFEQKPIESASEYCYILRKIVNSSEDRTDELLNILKEHLTAIIFYNFDYELDILRGLDYAPGTIVAEWNGHKHEPVPVGDKWVYLVQYTAGAEGWNCITTDTMIFYSQNYSYKIMAQSSGRIDRLNTPFKDLYYYHLKSRASIDLAISRAIKNKKIFTESGFAR